MWEISNLNQIISFLKSILLGGIFCLFFDIFRSLRRVFNFSAIWVLVQDIFVFAVLAPVTFCFLLATTNGEPRLYIFLGMITGFFAVQKALSPLFLNLMTSILKILKISAEFLSGVLCRFRDIILQFSGRVGNYLRKKAKKPKILRKNS